MRTVGIMLAVWCFVSCLPSLNGDDSVWNHVVSGTPAAVPFGYVPPLLSNGSVSMLVDYALHQTLIQNSETEIRIAPATPDDWLDFSFKLGCYGDGMVEVDVAQGQLTRLTLHFQDTGIDSVRAIVIPERYLDPATLDRRSVLAVERKDGCFRLRVRLVGEMTELIER